MRPFAIALAAAGLWLAITSTAQAGKVSTWRQASADEFRKGKLSRAVITSQGRVRLSRQVTLLADVEAAFVWDLAEGRDGSLCAATADPGKVVRIGLDGKPATLWTHSDGQVFSVAVGPDGAVYAGTGPDGLIYKIAPDNATSLFFKTGAKYVWDLAFDSEGNLLAATGPDGQLFVIDSKGVGKVLYDSNQPHLLCLALAKDGTVYAGTDQQALVYRIQRDGKAFVLHDAPQDEIRALLLSPEGTLYVATASAVPGGATPGRGPGGPPGSPGARSPQATRQNAIYRIDPDGAVRELLVEPVLFFSLARHGGMLLAGTGMSAVLYGLDESAAEHTQWASVDHEQVLALLSRTGGSFVFGTGGPGKIYQLGEGFVQEGHLTSDAFDAGMVSRWGALRWQAEQPAGTSVTVAVRAGNVAQPDDTWSAWSAEMTDAAGASVDCAAARFLQYRVTLKTANAGVSPALDKLSVRYITANRAPTVTQVTVPHVDEADGKSRLEKFRISWSASDPNSDELHYQLFFRKEDWRNWVKLAADLSQSNFDWDITSVPEGIYSVRVVASDAADNPDGDALTAENVSEPFLVDHTPPQVALRVAAGGAGTAAVELLAEDRFSPLVAAAYSVDSRPWDKVYPKDRLFDSRNESFAFELKGLQSGTHVLMVRATDAAGNTGTADTVFEIP